MTVSPDINDGCPRCGGTLEDMASGPVNCLNPACAAYWPSAAAWGRECIARDLAGTRKMKIGPEYVTEQLTTDVKELVALVEYMTYEKVLAAIRVSIAGRDDTYKARTGGLKTTIEIETLQKMYGWVLKESEKYGKEENEDDTSW